MPQSDVVTSKSKLLVLEWEMIAKVLCNDNFIACQRFTTLMVSMFFLATLFTQYFFSLPSNR